jgi:hypothetical protein
VFADAHVRHQTSSFLEERRYNDIFVCFAFCRNCTESCAKIRSICFGLVSKRPNRESRGVSFGQNQGLNSEKHKDVLVLFFSFFVVFC